MDKSIQNYVKDFIDLLDIVEKNPEVVEIKEKGNEQFKLNNYLLAIDYYNKAISKSFIYS